MIGPVNIIAEAGFVKKESMINGFLQHRRKPLLKLRCEEEKKGTPNA